MDNILSMCTQDKIHQQSQIVQYDAIFEYLQSFFSVIQKSLSKEWGNAPGSADELQNLFTD